MKSVEPKEPVSVESHMTPKISAPSVENLNRMDQSVKKMMKLLEDGTDPSEEKAEVYCQKKSELVACVSKFKAMYQSLAESYDELSKMFYPDLLSCDNSDSISKYAFPLLTPSPKRCNKKSTEAVGYDLFESSGGGGSSDLSLKEGSEASSFSSSDSEPESFNTNSKSLHHLEGDVGQNVISNDPWVAVEASGDFTVKRTQNMDYDDLRRRIADYEEKLRLSNQKLRTSEEEVAKLKDGSECVIVHAGSLQAEVEPRQQITISERIDADMETKQVKALEEKIFGLESCLSLSNHDKLILVSELQTSREKLQQSENEIAKLKHECADEISKSSRLLQNQLDFAWNYINTLEEDLASERTKFSEFQNKVEGYEDEIQSRECKVEELKAALSQAEETFSMEKVQLQSSATSLLEKQKLLEERLDTVMKEMELCRLRSAESKLTNEAKRNGFRSQIALLQAENAEKCQLVDSLNINLDRQKLDYDSLMAEKDGLAAQVSKLTEDLSIRETQSQQMEDQLRRLRAENEQLIAESKGAMELLGGLRTRVEELEKEVERQTVSISDGEEMKREVIRQLSFSVDHYKSGYRELRSAVFGKKQNDVMAV